MSVTVAPAPIGSGHGLPRPQLDRGSGRTALLVATTLLALLGTVALVWLAFRTSALPGVAISLLLAAVPVPFLLAAYLWLDRYEPEPRRFIVTALLWGAVVSTTVAGSVQALAAWADLPLNVMITVVAPLTEELAKGLLCVLVIVSRRRVVSLLDGIIYAGLVGVGFAFTENVLYYSGAYAGTLVPDFSGPSAATGVFAVRGLASPFAHPLFTTAIGIGVAVAVMTQRRWLRVTAPLLGYAGAVGMHAAWNGSTLLWQGLGFLAVYAGFMVPAFGVAAYIAIRALNKEADIVRTALQDAARRGWLHPAEIHWLVRFGDQAAARRFAGKVAGKAASTSLLAYQRAATEMALMHDRVLRGRAPEDGISRVVAHLERMHSWRPFVVMPPPMPPPGTALSERRQPIH